jgi:hypothetical protein
MQYAAVFATISLTISISLLLYVCRFLGSNMVTGDASSLVETPGGATVKHLTTAGPGLFTFASSSLSPPLRISHAAWSVFVTSLHSCQLRPQCSSDVLLYIDDLQRESQNCACQRVIGGREGRNNKIQWLVFCPKYTSLHFPPENVGPTHRVLTAVVPDSLLPEEAEEAEEEEEDGRWTGEVLPPYVGDRFSLERLVLSLPLPLQTNASSILRSESHCNGLGAGD